MTKNIVRLPEEIKQEFRIDSQGQVTTSIRGAARLADVDDRSIRKGLDLSADLDRPQLAMFLINNGFEGADLSNWIDTGIPDIAIAFILEYYAYECREDRRKEQAKKFCRAFRAIGFRAWAQQELGWHDRNASNKLHDAAFLIDIAAKAALNAGVDQNITEQLKLEGLAKLFPDYDEALLSYKNAIAASNPLPELPKTPTEIGQELAQRLGYEKISAKRINSKLLELGYQISVTRTKRSTGKEVHDYYQATEKGKNYSSLLMSAYTEGEGKSTKAQLKWFSSIVTVLANNWEDGND